MHLQTRNNICANVEATTEMIISNWLPIICFEKQKTFFRSRLIFHKFYFSLKKKEK
jgi:hypothetical protein